LKFKSIFLIFSTILLLFLAIITALPFIFLDPSSLISFWRINWPFVLALVLFFLGFNVFYIVNWRLFMLLEKENWPALARYLEDRVIKKNNYTPRLVRLLANTYLVLSDSLAVMSLENKVAMAKPSLLDKNALIFGTARILGKDISGAVRFFEIRRGTVQSGLKDWVSWYYGFALLLDRRFDDAGREFSFLAQLSRDAVITGLSSFFISENIAYILAEKKEDLLNISSAGRERVRKVLPSRTNWDNELARLPKEIHAAVISRHLMDAGLWLYNS
jgi:hypothetical protein